MRLPRGADTLWAELARPVGARPTLFDPSSLASLPAPAARWLRRVLPDAAPVVDGVIVAMRGEINLGNRWFGFTAEQVLRAGVGFVWKPVVGGRLFRFVGADLFGPDQARMEFRLHGLVPVAKASGRDVARSAAGRLAAETVAWLPHAVTPQADARWTAVDDRHATVTVDAAGTDVELTIAVGDDGRLESIDLRRWNNSIEPPGFEPFGADISGEFRTPDGVRVAGAGRVGWGHNTSSWNDGEFFHYTVCNVDWT